MKIGVAGSVGRDHIMTFPGKFSDSVVVGSLEKISLSFLVDGLEVRRGGCAANICFGLGVLGHKPLLIAAVGKDWPDYNASAGLRIARIRPFSPSLRCAPTSSSAL